MTGSPDASFILSASLEALGGLQAAQRVESIAGIADCQSPNGDYTTELTSARGDRLVFKQIRAGRDPFTAVIHGQYAWAIDPHTQEVESLDRRSAAMILSHDFLMLPFILGQRFTGAVEDGTASFAEYTCRKVRALDYWGQPCELYFDLDSHIWRGLNQINPVGEPGGTALGSTVQIVYTEWQRYEELLLPARIIIWDKTGEFRFAFKSIQLNVVADELFTIPAELRAQGRE